MPSNFETTNPGWQLQQQVGEELACFLVRDSQHYRPPRQIPAWLQQGVCWLIVAGFTVWVSWKLYRLRPGQRHSLHIYVNIPINLGSFAASCLVLAASQWISRWAAG